MSMNCVWAIYAHDFWKDPDESNVLSFRDFNTFITCIEWEIYKIELTILFSFILVQKKHALKLNSYYWMVVFQERNSRTWMGPPLLTLDSWSLEDDLALFTFLCGIWKNETPPLEKMWYSYTPRRNHLINKQVPSYLIHFNSAVFPICANIVIIILILNIQAIYYTVHMYGMWLSVFMFYRVINC